MEKSVAILTNFMDFNPGYSLSGIVVDQALMLLRQGHSVFVFVNEQFNPRYNDDARISILLEKYKGRFEIVRRTKFMHLTDYQTKTAIKPEHQSNAEEAGNIFAKEIMDREIHVVYTHDFIFTGWNLPYSLAVKRATAVLDENQVPCNWYHWIHSVPFGSKDWWNIEQYGRRHQIVFPNRTTIMPVAENFQTTPARIRIIPHIKDIRTWYDFSERTMEFIDTYPSIVEAEVVQVYPCSSDRLDAKQLDIVIHLFSFFKELNAKVCLVAANQWATGRQPMQNVGKYVKMAQEAGLEYGKEFIFTSEYLSHPEVGNQIFDCTDEEELAHVLKVMKKNGLVEEKWQQQGVGLEERKDKLCEWIRPYAKGIDRRMLRELQLCGSLFVFPTREESFGLVGPESAYSGCLNVNNRSLIMMSEIMGSMAPAFDFGSHHLNHPPSKDPDYLKAVALAVLQRMYMNESVMTKIHCRKRYNMENVYRRYYRPLTLA